MTTATFTRDPSTTPDAAFARPAELARLEATARALEANGFVVLIARDRGQARELVLGLLPAGGEVHQGASQTLDDLGLTGEVGESGRYDAVRPRLWRLDRRTQAREMRKLGAAPDFMLGSVNAVTEDGSLVVASKTGSQLGPYAFGAGRVIWVVGAQKVVADLDEAFRRIERYSLPLENERSRAAYGVDSAINKVLVIRGEAQPARATVVLVREPVGA